MIKYNQIISLALKRGFYFPSCEIYSDKHAGFWEYGPLGVNLKNKFIELWRKELIRRDNIIEIDGSQIMSKSVFDASGHIKNFVDPIIKCKKCRSTFRVDKLIKDTINIEITENEKIKKYEDIINSNNIRCTVCGGELQNPYKFNMMFSVGVGIDNEIAYLRPETCQSIFVDFPRIFKTMRGKLPFGIAQIGKSFRNEIAPRQNILRLREFYQAEIEIFCNPNNFGTFEKFVIVEDTIINVYIDNEIKKMTCKEIIDKNIIDNKLIVYYIGLLTEFYKKTGIDISKTRFRKVTNDERAFYSDYAFDFEAETSVGWIELVSCNYRSNHDLLNHSNQTKESFEVADSNCKIIPHVFEISMGVDRSIYSIMDHNLKNDVKNNRIVLSLKPYLAPIHVGILSLMKKDGLEELTNKIYYKINRNFDSFLDHSGSIGRRYRRLDEIGTPYIITVDHQTLIDQTVTIRIRDTMKQTRIKITDISFILKKNTEI